MRRTSAALLCAALGLALGHAPAARADNASARGAEGDGDSAEVPPGAEQTVEPDLDMCALHEVEAGRLRSPDGHERAAMPCRFEAGAKEAASAATRVHVAYALESDGKETVLERTRDERACGDGYRVEQTEDGSRIVLCPSVCAALQGESEARLRIRHQCGG